MLGGFELYPRWVPLIDRVLPNTEILNMFDVCSATPM